MLAGFNAEVDIHLGCGYGNIPNAHAKLPEPAAAACLKDQQWSGFFHTGSDGLNRVDNSRTGYDNPKRHAAHPAAPNRSSADHPSGWMADPIQNPLYLWRHSRQNQNVITRHSDLFNPFLNHLHQIFNPHLDAGHVAVKKPEPGIHVGNRLCL